MKTLYSLKAFSIYDPPGPEEDPALHDETAEELKSTILPSLAKKSILQRYEHEDRLPRSQGHQEWLEECGLQHAETVRKQQGRGDKYKGSSY